MDPDNIHCRLCAELKHSRKQVDLQSNTEKRFEVTDKLTRINAITEFVDSKFPSTVCLECLRKLDKCFEFVIGIESAQNTLSDIYFSKQNVKTEQEENVADDPSESEALASCEYKEFEADVKDEVKVNPEETKIVNSPDKDSDSSDSVLLSQLQQKLTWVDYKWLCFRCDLQFQKIEDLQVHSMAVHNVCNPYRCGKCKIRKKILDQFLIHVQGHNIKLRRSCYQCFKEFRLISSVQKHRKTHIKSSFSCPGCNASFETNDELKQHKVTFYDFNMKRNIDTKALNGKTCLICSKTFQNRNNVEMHVIRKHMGRKPELICEVCGKAFFDKIYLSKHILFVHTDYRPHKCQICKLGFKTPRSLEDHVGRHFNEKPLACEKCGKSFRLQKHLAKHSVIHSNQFPFQCNYCDKRFQRKAYLTNHLLQHTGETLYSCEPCQQFFTSWGNYNKHMKCRHNKDTARKKAVLVDEL